MISVSIIGVGRVGGAIALSLPSEKYRIENLVVRQSLDANWVGPLISRSTAVLSLDSLNTLSSDIIFITTPDSSITEAARSIANRIAGPATVFHTSGSYSSALLTELANVGCQVGSLHPLVSISRADLGPERFSGAYFCVEGTAEAVSVGKRIVSDLGGKPFSVDTRFKTLYHAAAVTACGHLVALFDAAVEMMGKCGLSAEDSKQILTPLVASTVKNLSEQSTAAALTGTFARADIETFTRHLTALNENVSDDLLEIYLLLGERSLELAAKQGVNQARIDSLRTKVSIAKSKLKW